MAFLNPRSPLFSFIPSVKGGVPYADFDTADVFSSYDILRYCPKSLDLFIMGLSLLIVVIK